MAVDYKYDEKTGAYVPKQETIEEGNVSDNDRILAIIAWAIQFFMVTLWPIVVILLGYLFFKGKSYFLSETCREILNFQITLLIMGVVSFVLIFVLIGIPLALATLIYGIAIPIFGILEANQCRLFRTPIVYQFVR